MGLNRRQVAVFIDYQNCYNWARRAFFGPADAPSNGHFNPRKFAELLAAKGVGRYELLYTGVYFGLPDATLDPRTYAARRKQMARWTALGATPIARPLRYPGGKKPGQKERPVEKGVDVKLAVDAVMKALRGQYEVGIIASCDSDLVPAVEAILELGKNPVLEERVLAAESTMGETEIEQLVLKQVREGTRKVEIEVVGWAGQASRISVPGVPARWINDKDFRAVHDDTDYTA